MHNLIRETHLVPDSQTSVSGAWPWPVKIYTLGRFEVQLDGAPLPPRRKAPYRVLTLLKAIIAFGGHDIAISRLIDALWPEAEGDRGQETFNKTLQRLRRLLTHKHVIQIRDRKVSLNRQLCWVDAMAFEKGEAHSAADHDRVEISSSHHIHERRIALYRGPFLDDECQDWIDRRRERLRRQFAQAVQHVSEWKKAEGQEEAAVRYLDDALIIDPLAEPLYFWLITWCQAAGRQDNAKTVWAQYRRAVVEGAGREPSSKMRHLAESVS